MVEYPGMQLNIVFDLPHQIAEYRDEKSKSG